MYNMVYVYKLSARKGGKMCSRSGQNKSIPKTHLFPGLAESKKSGFNERLFPKIR